MAKQRFFYELLVRGGPDGIKGAHAVYLTRTIDDDDGDVTDKVGDAVPVAMAQGDPGIPLADVLGEPLTQALATIEGKDAQITTLQGDNATLTGERNTAQALAAQLQAQIDALAPVINGVPQEIDFRQAKTFMQLYPVGDSDLWTVANAAADAIPDRAERITMQNLLRDSTKYLRQNPKLSPFAASLGINSDALDAMFVAAKKL